MTTSQLDLQNQAARSRRSLRLVRAFALAAAMALGMVAAVAAPASAAPSSPGSIYQTSDGWCHFSTWGGTFYCEPGVNATVRWLKPDGYWQVFVLGTNQSLYTRWANAQNTYPWKNEGGKCLPQYGVDGTA